MTLPRSPLGRGYAVTLWRSMARTPRKSKDAIPQARRWRSALAIVITLAVACGIFLAFDQLGGEALRRIGLRERYRVAFTDVRCEAPPGLDRRTFLTEVRYVAKFPEFFNALDDADREQLGKAFAAHPWVEAVEGVSVEPGDAVTVRLKFRVPVLAVRVDRGAVRLVDGHGVLLPEAEEPRSVAELLNIVPAPTSPAGQVWHDDTVRRAVEMVKAYRPKSLELTAKGWRLIQADGKAMSVGK